MQAITEGRERPKLYPPLALVRHQETATGQQPCAVARDELRRIVAAMLG